MNRSFDSLTTLGEQLTFMDRLFQSVALAHQLEGDKSKLLLRWQADQNCWMFIVADRLNKESFRESVTRELAWQLNLNRKTDFLVSNMAQLSMEYVETMPDASQRHIAVAFYNVHIYRKNILEYLSRDSACRWLSAAEVCRGRTTDEQTIHPRVVNWINKWSVVQPWQ